MEKNLTQRREVRLRREKCDPREGGATEKKKRDREIAKRVNVEREVRSLGRKKELKTS